MIEHLDLGDTDIAAQVLELQRLAYRAEADLIGLEGIPPLHESIDDLRGAELDWLGIRDGERLVAALATVGVARLCDIDRLVVHPAHHRQGHGRRLVQAVLHHSSVTVWAIETNTPAVALYESLGFRRLARREVAPGVWSAQFERWHRHLKTSFDADVAGYEAARPGYPDALFDLLSARCGLGSGARVLEVGPGTGQATVPLLDCGATVVAVEPGVAMAARLRERVEGRSCTVVEAEFEHADVDGPFDLAVAATSFHWTPPSPRG